MTQPVYEMFPDYPAPRILVCGGRDFTDRTFVDGLLDGLHRAFCIREVIQGGASGVDSFARAWAEEQDEVEVRTFYADWAKDGPAAGPIRNQRMLDVGRPDYVIAFPGGKGTADMVRRAKAAGIEVIEIPPSIHDRERR